MGDTSCPSIRSRKPLLVFSPHLFLASGAAHLSVASRSPWETLLAPALEVASPFSSSHLISSSPLVQVIFCRISQPMGDTSCPSIRSRKPLLVFAPHLVLASGAADLSVASRSPWETLLAPALEVASPFSSSHLITSSPLVQLIFLSHLAAHGRHFLPQH